jgi:serine/threonine protein kinase
MPGMISVAKRHASGGGDATRQFYNERLEARVSFCKCRFLLFVACALCVSMCRCRSRSRGVVKLADFGLARLTAEVAETDCDDGAALGEGSLPWMAPELINQAPPPTPAADVFRSVPRMATLRDKKRTPTLRDCPCLPPPYFFQPLE